ncbi:hypothetical protein CKA32_002238 [Geitlerinema sp. FC II]|nr:hypothetical protein CKA32_002238 [Geitlerinema sp. FC II]
MVVGIAHLSPNFLELRFLKANRLVKHLESGWWALPTLLQFKLIFLTCKIGQLRRCDRLPDPDSN